MRKVTISIAIAALILAASCSNRSTSILPTAPSPSAQIAATSTSLSIGQLWLWFPARTMSESLVVRGAVGAGMLVMLPRNRGVPDSICTCNPDTHDSSYVHIIRLDRVGIDTLPTFFDSTGTDAEHTFYFRAALRNDTLAFKGHAVTIVGGLTPGYFWGGQVDFRTSQPVVGDGRAIYHGGWFTHT